MATTNKQKQPARYEIIIAMVVLLLLSAHTVSNPSQLTNDQLINRVQRQTGAKVISLSQIDSKQNTAQVQLLYPNGEIKQRYIDTRNGKSKTPPHRLGR